MIVTIANEKGGSGKSNIAINLAIKLFSMNEDLLLVDSDPQNSIRVFNDIRVKKEIPLGFNCVNVFGDSLSSQISLLQNKYKSLIIDTAGRDCDEMREALSISDILIIPTLPSDIDIAVLNKMIKLYSQYKHFKRDLKAFIVISKASPNPALKDKIKALKEYIEDKKIEDLK
ncbi:AAA family ATPase [Campylobacter troglodytis]|uniref:AAA family ATPase n=1 Tax=Campylobacter troglodytis TaxID=654363 RepID=UPI00115A562B|nr:AAA family ATPase [Campylobacter troglodytis]TQR56259.1 chromosome partitioning protein ParA [Campylobacter troglodytis]